MGEFNMGHIFLITGTYTCHDGNALELEAVVILSDLYPLYYIMKKVKIVATNAIMKLMTTKLVICMHMYYINEMLH